MNPEAEKPERKWRSHPNRIPPAQDGSYLAEFLIEKGYQVHGIMRRSSSFNTARIQHLYKDPMTHQQGCAFPFRANCFQLKKEFSWEHKKTIDS